jgi:hypothetical protein
VAALSFGARFYLQQTVWVAVSTWIDNRFDSGKIGDFIKYQYGFQKKRSF